VRRARHRAIVGPRGIEGLATRMVGRDAELGELQRAFERLDRDRAGSSSR
jgi:hypothetical protein